MCGCADVAPDSVKPFHTHQAIGLPEIKSALTTNVLKIIFEDLERVWDDMYASRYGFWRISVMAVIYKCLDCGDLHMRFVRVRCEECGHTLKGRN